MFEGYGQEDASGTERRRSRSGVPDAGGPGNAGSDLPRADGPGDADAGTEEPLHPEVPRLMPQRKGRRLVKKKAPGETRPQVPPEERLLLLDLWQRSGLPAKDFGALVGVSPSQLYGWKRKFEKYGPAGLMDQPRGAPKGSRVPELTKRTILMLKGSNPEYGCQRISDMLVRGPALPVCAEAVARVLREAGYVLEEVPTRPHRQKTRRFERGEPNELWQTDLFTFVLKRQNRRVYLVVFLDDRSRFIVGYGVHASQSTALVLEVLRSAIASHGSPREILSDNGAQYVTWRGKSAFSKELDKRGIKHLVSRPKHPQTLGKVERFWGTLWRECLESAVFLDLGDAQRRIGLFIDYYNFQRPHQGIDGLVPADWFFRAAPEVLRTLKERMAGNALELARDGIPKAPFYLTGQVGGKGFSVHAEGERIFMTRAGEEREEIDLEGEGPVARELGDRAEASEDVPEALCPQGVVTSGVPGVGHEEPPPPGVSPIDVLTESLSPDGERTEDDLLAVENEAGDETEAPDRTGAESPEEEASEASLEKTEPPGEES